MNKNHSKGLANNLLLIPLTLTLSLKGRGKFFPKSLSQILFPDPFPSLRTVYIIASILILLIAFPTYGQKSLWHNSGKIAMLMSDWGIIGKLDNQGTLSFNFRYSLTEAESIFYMSPFSEIWLGDAKGNVASAFDPSPDGGITVGEWMPTQTGGVKYVGDPSIRQEILSQYQLDPRRRLPFDITVDQCTYSWNASDRPEDSEFIIMKLTLTNRSPIAAENLYLAACADWDVDVLDPGGDLADWDAKRQAGFFFNDLGANPDANPTYVATVILDGPVASYNIVNRALWRFEDKLRSTLMSNKEIDTVQTIGKLPGNYLSVISAGPFSLKGRIPTTVVFAFVAGKDLKAFQTNVDRARETVLMPSNLSAEAMANSIRLSWLPSISPKAVGYKVYRSEKSGSGYLLAEPRILNATSYEDKNIKGGTKYYYVVRSIDVLGNELATSAEIEVQSEPKAQPPRNLVAISEGNSIRITWGTPSGETVKEYKIYRNESAKPPWTQIATVRGTETSFVDLNVFPNLKYFYVISSVVASGQESNLTNPAVASIPQQIEQAKSTLEEVVAAPNPYSLSKYQNVGGVKFLNLTEKARIFIYSLNGELVRELDHRDGRSSEIWDLKNEDGIEVSSGIYIYRITALVEGKEKLSANGKIAVIR